MNAYDKYEEDPVIPSEEGGEIDFGELLRKLIAKWKIIAAVTCVFGIIGIIAALSMQRKWGVTVTLAPEVSVRSNLGGVSSLLGVSDIALGSNSDAMRVTIYPEICKSTPFLARLLNVEVTPFVSPESVAAGTKVVPTTLLKHLIGEDNIKEKHKEKYFEQKAEYDKYYDDSVVDYSNLTPHQAGAIRALKSCITASLNNKTGITSINVVMDDRRMATQLADTVCSLLQEYVTEYRTKKARADYEYYSTLTDEAKERLIKAQNAYAAAVDYNRSVILQSVNSEKDRLQSEMNVAQQLYSQMAQHREMAKAKIQEDKPAYAVIQPATMPLHPMNSRKKTVLMWGFAGFILACLGVLFIPELKKMLSPAKKEEEEEN